MQMLSALCVSGCVCCCSIYKESEPGCVGLCGCSVLSVCSLCICRVYGWRLESIIFSAVLMTRCSIFLSALCGFAEPHSAAIPEHALNKSSVSQSELLIFETGLLQQP